MRMIGAMASKSPSQMQTCETVNVSSVAQVRLVCHAAALAKDSKPGKNAGPAEGLQDFGAPIMLPSAEESVAAFLGGVRSWATLVRLRNTTRTSSSVLDLINGRVSNTVRSNASILTPHSASVQ